MNLLKRTPSNIFCFTSLNRSLHPPRCHAVEADLGFQQQQQQSGTWIDFCLMCKQLVMREKIRNLGMSVCGYSDTRIFRFSDMRRVANDSQSCCMAKRVREGGFRISLRKNHFYFLLIFIFFWEGGRVAGTREESSGYSSVYAKFSSVQVSSRRGGNAFFIKSIITISTSIVLVTSY